VLRERKPLGAEMYTSLRRLSLSVLIVLLFSSCAEAGSQGTADVVRNLRTTNLDSNQFPWTRGLADGRTKRWDIEHDGLIPVKFNGSTLAQEATAEIEAVLHMSIFDTTSIANLSDNMIVRGIIISEGTAIGPNGVVTRNTCGHVSAHPGRTDFPEEFYNSEGRINTRLYVSLSSKKCTASIEIAIHEFGHALGLGEHFSGFGSGDAIAPSFWQVLYTLYNNDVGTFTDDLEIKLLDQLYPSN
jgi:hypothetical protein